MKFMRSLTPGEKRTVRFGAIGIVIYLVLFGGLQVWKILNKQRFEYLLMVSEARLLKSEVMPFTDKAAIVKKLMDEYHLDPARLPTNSVVADATAAIQKAATAGGIQPGPIRETSGQSANKELAAIQFEGTGKVASVMALLDQLPTLGYPLVIDSVQIASSPMMPGQVKLNVTIFVLNFQQWKKPEAPHA